MPGGGARAAAAGGEDGVRACARHSGAQRGLRASLSRPAPPREGHFCLSCSYTDGGSGLALGARGPLINAARLQGASEQSGEPSVTAATMSSGDSGIETRLSPWGPAGRAFLRPQRLLVSRKRTDGGRPPGCSGAGPWGAVAETPSVLAVA